MVPVSVPSSNCGFRLVNKGRGSEHAVVNDRMRRILSMTLLLAALGMFVAFHFLTTLTDPDYTKKGWKVWTELYDLLRNPENLDPWIGIAVSSFLMFTLLISGTPFLSIVWQRSRMVWGMVTVFSGLSAACFALRLVVLDGVGDLALGGWFAVTAPFLNFLGLLLARRWRQEPSNPRQSG